MDQYIQNVIESSELFNNEKNYWFNKLQGEFSLGIIPEDNLTVNKTGYAGELSNYSFPDQICEKLLYIGNNSEYGIYIILLAGVMYLLAKYTGNDDIIIGMPVFKGESPLNPINNGPLPIRNTVDFKQDFKELIYKIKQTVTEADEFKNYPFGKIAELLKPHSDNKQPFAFNTVVLMESIHDRNCLTKVRTDLIFSFGIKGASLEMTIEYNQYLYYRETIDRLAVHLVNIFRRMLENPEIRLQEIDFLSEKEKQQLLVDFNNTQKEYQKEKTVHLLFEEQVERMPDSIAVIFREQTLTYRELNFQANQLARILRKKGVQKDNIVGIMLKRSPQMIISIMAVLKAGGSYLPIDPGYPPERVLFMVADSQAILLLTQQELTMQFNLQTEILYLDNMDLQEADASNLNQINTAKDLAYVIYTSGSTGKPKGVMIEHRSLHNFIGGITEKIEFTSGKMILGITTISFDIFGLEILVPLVKGLTIVLADENEQYDPQLVKKLFQKHKIDMLQATPSRMQTLINDTHDLSWLKNINVLMIGGESFPDSLFHQLVSLTDAKIYNMYGPTETTIWSTVKEVTVDNKINIGKPLFNTRIYIVDRSYQLQPVGVAGELCIAGDGLARGYWQRTELTVEKFIPNPFQPEERMYCTGDLARWLPDGNIEFLGRFDHQVKIRGYRIELGEIENQLLNHESIKEAIVVAKEDSNGNKSLCAYWVGDRELSVQDFRMFLSNYLPEYMIPVYFIRLERLPLTPNGKIDRKALPEPSGEMNAGIEYVAPGTDLEVIISGVWKEMLKIDKVGVNNSFFHIGGNSFNLVEMNVLLNQKLQRQIPTVVLFQYPTVRSLAQYLTQQEGIEDHHINEITKLDDSIELMEQSLQAFMEE